MTATDRRFVHHRARSRCEYGHLPQAGHEERFSVDHVVAQSHRENDATDNLALCCLRCDLHKGTNLSGLDPANLAIVPLFNPRQQTWAEHFRWDGPHLAGRTPAGRVTVATLHMNAPERVRLRTLLIAEGLLDAR